MIVLHGVARTSLLSLLPQFSLSYGLCYLIVPTMVVQATHIWTLLLVEKLSRHHHLVVTI